MNTSVSVGNANMGCKHELLLKFLECLLTSSYPLTFHHFPSQIGEAHCYVLEILNKSQKVPPLAIGNTPL